VDKRHFIVLSETKKVCPECGQKIDSKWESSFNLEWCPTCGCNVEACEQKGELNLI